jgi:hypothetical protein
MCAESDVAAAYNGLLLYGSLSQSALCAVRHAYDSAIDRRAGSSAAGTMQLEILDARVQIARTEEQVRVVVDARAAHHCSSLRRL